MSINVNFPKQISLLKRAFLDVPFPSFFSPPGDAVCCHTFPVLFPSFFHSHSCSTRMQPLDFSHSPWNPKARREGQKKFFPKLGVHCQPPSFKPVPALLLMSRMWMNITFVDRRVIFLSDQTGKKMCGSSYIPCSAQKSRSWLFEGCIVLQLSITALLGLY